MRGHLHQDADVARQPENVVVVHLGQGLDHVAVVGVVAAASKAAAPLLVTNNPHKQPKTPYIA